MIALDTNLLVYAHREEMSFHEPARTVLSDLVTGVGTWAIPWPCVHEFLAIVTHPRIFDPPTPREVALDSVSGWVESAGLVLLAEADGYLQVLRTLLEAGQIAGPMVHDARIAAICVSHGVRELWSADRDLSRFPSLRVRNPLVA